MSPNWFIAASPLLLLGVPMVLFADRNLDHQRQNMREGKEYLWQEKFRPAIGLLIHELNEDFSFTREFVRFRSALQNESTPDPDGIQSVEDIPQKILNDAAFTPAIREITDSIGNHSQQMANLEGNYQELEGHLRMLGVSLIVTYFVLASAEYFYGNTTPEFLLIAAGMILAYGGDQAWNYVSKKKELRKYADKYENHREV